jgi:hypothetical protein
MNACSIKGTPYEGEYRQFMSEELMVYVWNKNNEQPLDKIKLNNEVIENPLYTELMAHPITNGDRKVALKLIAETFQRNFKSKYTPNEQGLFELTQVLDYTQQRQKAAEDALNQKIQNINIPTSKSINFYGATINNTSTDIHYTSQEGEEIFDSFAYLLGQTKSWKGVQEELIKKRNELLSKAKAKTIRPAEVKQLVNLEQIIQNFDMFKSWFDNQEDSIGLEQLEAELGETQDWKTKDKSQKERASKKILSLVAVLPAYRNAAAGEFNFAENRPYRKDEKVIIEGNVLGLPKAGDFQKNWAILSAELSGITDYNKLYQAVEKLSDSQPQYKTLLANIPNPKLKISVQNINAFLLAMGMKRVFSNPEIVAVSVDITKKDGVTSVTQQIKGIRNSKNLINQLDKQYFVFNKDFALVGENGTEFNTDKFVSEFLRLNNLFVNVFASARITDKRQKIKELLSNKVNFDKTIDLLNALGIGLSNRTYLTPNYLQETVDAVVDNMSKITALIKKFHILSAVNEILKERGEVPIKVEGPLTFLASNNSRLFPDGQVLSESIKSALSEVVTRGLVARPVTLAKDVESKINGLANFLKKKETELTPILNYFGKFDISLRPSSYLNAEDKKKYIRSPWFYLTQTTKAINEATSYEQLITTPGYERFDYRKDPNILGSLWLKTLFGLPSTIAEIEKKPLSEYKKQTKFGEPIQLEIRDYNGTEIKGYNKKSGRTTTNQHPGDKVLQDFLGFFQSTEVENIRFGDKSSAFSIHFTNPVLKEKLFVPITVPGLEGILNSEAELEGQKNFVEIMKNYLGSEFKRIVESLEREGRGTTYDKYAKNLFIFKDILPAPIIDAIKGAESKEVLVAAYKLAIEKLPESLENYFDKQADILTDQIVKYLSISIKKKSLDTKIESERVAEALSVLNGIKFINTQLLPKNYAVKLNAQSLRYLAKNYLQNNFINNIEFLKVFVGDLANFDKTDKDAREVFKRIPFTSSPGDAIFWDSAVESFFETDTNQDALSRAIAGVSKKFSPIVRTVIYNDVLTFDKKDWETYKKVYDSGIWETLSTTEQYEYNAYTANPKEADAQGVVTLDFYRNYLLSLEGWSDAQEDAYNLQVRIAEIQQELKTNPSNAAELLKEKAELIAQADIIPFPPLKLGHFGPIVQDPRLAGLHKFSLVPLVPSAIEGKQLEKQLTLMYQNGVDYYTFKSGSKMAQYGKPIDFYKEEIDSEGNKVKVINDALSADNATDIHLHNLRQQQYQAPKFKGESTLATQMMKLMFGDYYEYGELSSDLSTEEKEEVTSLYDRLKTNLNNLVSISQINLERKLGIVRDADGKIESLNQLQLARYLATEFEKKNMPSSLRAYIQVDSDGNFKHPLDAINNRDAIETMLLNVINNKIISQKIHGESYIQVAGTGFETRRFANPTVEQLEQYGANELQFYRYDSITNKTLPMEVKIGFNSKKHAGLFQLPYQGGKVGNLETLNQILKSDSPVDQAWREQHMDYITMVGVRIPVQGASSMDHVIVKEFLPEAVGAIMVLPAQIVVKSGGDYDIDKLTFFETAFDAEGNITKKAFEIKNYEEALSKQKELTKTKQELTNLLKIVGDESNVNNVFKQKKELKAEIDQIKAEIKAAIEAIDYLDNEFISSEDKQAIVETVSSRDEIKNKILEIQSLNQSIDKTALDFIAEIKSELNKLSKEITEIRNIRQGITNELVSTLKDILSLGSKYDSMTAPNNNNILTQSEFVNNSKPISTTDVFNPLTSWRVYLENILSKDALGIDAKINTLQKEFQRAGLKFSNPILNTYYFKANKDADGNIQLGGQKDQAGNRISKILSEFVNGHVDIAKEDWIILLGMDETTSPLAHAMILAGTPVMDVINFIKSDPVQQVLELSNKPELYKKVTKHYMNRASAIVALVQSKANTLDSPAFRKATAEIASLKEEKSLSSQQVLEAYIEKFLTIPGINSYIQNFDPNDTKLTEQQKTLRDIAYLLQFGVVATQQDKLRDLTSNIDFNTANYRTTFQSVELLQKEGGLANYFNKEALSFMFSDSTLAQFNVTKFTLDLMRQVFPLSDSAEVHEALNKFLEYSNINNVDLRTEAIKTFKNNLLFTYAVATARNEKGLLLEQYRGPQGILTANSPNSIIARFEKLGTNYDLANNFLFNNLYVDNTNLTTDGEIIFKLKNTEFEEYSKDYREAFLEGLNSSNPEIKQFFTDLALGSFIQFGPHFESGSVASVIPYEVYIEYTEKAYKDLQDMKTNNPAKFKEYLSLVGFATLLDRNITGPSVVLPSFLTNQKSLYISTISSLNMSLVRKYQAIQNRVFGLSTVTQKATVSTQPSTIKPKGKEVKAGIFVNEGAISKEEQLELFNYLKPFLEEQAGKTNKGAYASKMIGLGLRWDYKSNNSGRTAVNIPDVINPANKTKYGYYTESINGQPLGQISNRFREIIAKATGLDMSMYDGAIINLYDNDSFISSHNDVDESRSAINYPVVGINLGGPGNFSIESRDGSPMQLNLDAGTAYVFGVNGVNREVFHRTFPTAQNSFLPELTTKLDNKTYEAGSYRVTITMRRVMPLESTTPSVNPLIEAGVKPSDMVGNAAKDIQMAAESTQFIGFQSGNATVSSTNKYREAWGDRANTGNYTASDVVMVSGSGLFRGVTEAQIKETLTNRYKPLLNLAIEAGASFRVGNQYAKGNLSDQLVAQYLKSKGYQEEKLTGYSRWTPKIDSDPSGDLSNLEQNLLDESTIQITTSPNVPPTLPTNINPDVQLTLRFDSTSPNEKGNLDDLGFEEQSCEIPT